MQLFRDYQGREIRLTDERLAHIFQQHPYMTQMEYAIHETLEDPDAVVASNTNPNAHLYYRWYPQTDAGAKYMTVVVIIDLNDAFVASAYVRERIRRGTLIWLKR